MIPERINRFSGKPEPANTMRRNGSFCEHCGTECIDNCPLCGAPQCCPKCCVDAEMEYQEQQARRQ